MCFRMFFHKDAMATVAAVSPSNLWQAKFLLGAGRLQGRLQFAAFHLSPLAVGVPPAPQPKSLTSFSEAKCRQRH